MNFREQTNNNKSRLWCDLAAFWIFGLCNNYGYCIVLCGANDIIAKLEAENVS